MVINDARSPSVESKCHSTLHSVAALLTYKLKNGETPPDNGYAAHSSGVGNVCSFCHSDGAVVQRTLIVRPERRSRVRIAV
jgi:hypothetical protein